ncbi:hypothetical protein NVP2275O_010 [Vibrio phage 2.275.O._10N.286.54.E11]|nr:hypothetical protein NVP2275O_010 [Vibrio phage 2.275.O._10N.286.54.E11]
MTTVHDTAPDEMYCTLDLSDMSNVDYYFHNILNTVAFSAMSAELEIGNHTMSVPINWQILLGDEESGMMEMSTIEDIMNIKEPHAFVLNPIKSMFPTFLPVKVKNIFTINARWQIPMLKKKHLLAVPIVNQENPLCAFFADESDKITDFFLGD